MRFLSCDTETGGLDFFLYSLLTLHMSVLDDDLNVVDSLSLSIKHKVYKISPGALKVNKIDLVRHDETAIPVENAQVMLENFIMTHGSRERLMFMAHNVPFDKGFLSATFNMSALDKFLDYHTLDTVTLGVIEKMLGTMSKNQSLSLGRIADTLKLEKGEAHTASGDVTTMINYLRDFKTRYTALVRGSK